MPQYSRRGFSKQNETRELFMKSSEMQAAFRYANRMAVYWGSQSRGDWAHEWEVYAKKIISNPKGFSKLNRPACVDVCPLKYKRRPGMYQGVKI